MKAVRLAAAGAGLLALVAGAAPAGADPVIVPAPGPLAFFDAFFGGAYFGGGGGDGRNAYPWTDHSLLSPAPSIGCYFTRARADNAWRRVEVCY